MWGGRFATGPAEAMDRLNRSLPVDRRMWREDLAGSMAWCTALRDAGVLEIGFGMGDATVQIAQAMPGTDFLGVEVYPAGVGSLHALVLVVPVASLSVVGTLHGERLVASALSPSASSTAIGVLTFTPCVPSATKISSTVPSSTASTSIVALSVSISAITSPAFKASGRLLSG